MAADPRRQRALLVGLVALLAVVLWWQFGPVTAGPGAAAPPRAATPSRGAAPATSPAETLAAGVALDRLGQMPTAPVDSGRDPFTLGPARGSGVSAGGGAGLPEGLPEAVPSVPVAPVPTGPPPPPAITVKFIGVVERDDVGTVAVLSDGRNVYYGREGEIVDGRWRIVRIGEESLQIEHADGTGRQTVRLTG